jgi:Na+/proline symporter
MLSAASHGTDHLIVQRLLATRSLRDARVALVGSGLVVFLQFLLFLLVGTAIWATRLVPDSVPSDQIFPGFVLAHLPAGLAGLVVAGILAAAMGTHSSAINALASSLTHDLYVGWSGRRDPAHLLRVGRIFSAVWGVALMVGALGFLAFDREGKTPVVVLALSVASIAYGSLLGTYLLAGRWSRANGRDVVTGAAVSLAVMLAVFFAKALAQRPGLEWLTPVGQLAWPWYVPLGTGLTVAVGTLSRFLSRRPDGQGRPA